MDTTLYKKAHFVRYLSTSVKHSESDEYDFAELLCSNETYFRCYKRNHEDRSSVRRLPLAGRSIINVCLYVYFPECCAAIIITF